MVKQCKRRFQQWFQNMKPKGKNQGGMKQPNSDGLQDYPEPKPSNAPAPEVCENKIQPVESPKVVAVTSTPNEASEAKIAQLMEVFSLGPEHRKTVTSFVMSQKATAEVSELASRFCEHVLPGLSLNM